jgi:hypothetical protein
VVYLPPGTRIYSEDNWLAIRIQAMVAGKKISQEDIAEINIDALQICPFCEILGEHTSSKVPADRKVSQATSKMSADGADDSDEIDLDYVPQPPSGSEDDEYDSDEASEESCEFVSSSDED